MMATTSEKRFQREGDHVTMTVTEHPDCLYITAVRWNEDGGAIVETLFHEFGNHMPNYFHLTERRVHGKVSITEVARRNDRYPLGKTVRL